MIEPSDEQMQSWRDYAGQATVTLVEAGEVSQEMLDRMQALLEEVRSGNGG